MSDLEAQDMDDTANRRSGIVGAQARCFRQGCDAEIPPQRLRRGPAKRYCSDACRRLASEEAHPRLGTTQRALQLTAVPPTGEPYEATRIWLLGRLQAGPVRCLDLRGRPWPASANPGQRVLELRQRQHDIRTMRALGTNWYLLLVDGEPQWSTDAWDQDSARLRQAYGAGEYRWRERG